MAWVTSMDSSCDKLKLLSDCIYVQSEQSLCLSPMPHCWISKTIHKKKMLVCCAHPNPTYAFSVKDPFSLEFESVHVRNILFSANTDQTAPEEQMFFKCLEY